MTRAGGTHALVVLIELKRNPRGRNVPVQA